MQSNARRHTSTRSLSDLPCKNGRTEERRTRDTAGERAAKRIKLQFAVSSSGASRSDATAGGDAASARTVVAGVSLIMLATLSDAAQDTAMSGGADRRRTIPRVAEDDEERAKRQRTEKKTELEMEVSNAAKINEFWTCDATDGSWKTSDSL